MSRPSVGLKLTGAGSTFVYPLLAKWATAYDARSGTQVNYQSIGSGGGIKQIENQTVDFGATDMPLDHAGLERRGLTQFPLVAGAIVPVVHLSASGTARLKLSGSALARIYLGEIRRWNDPILLALNPHLTLPDRFDHRGSPRRRLGHQLYLDELFERDQSGVARKIGAARRGHVAHRVGGKGNEGSRPSSNKPRRDRLRRVGVRRARAFEPPRA